MDSKNKIHVEIRIKPSVENYLDSSDSSVTVGTKTYNFHKIHLTTSQKQLYKNSVEPLLVKFIQGYNCSVLAYGQTGSGKTYTMGISDSDTSGVVPQALEYLFSQQESLSCTFIEIYNEDVIDLLSTHKVPLSLREIKGEVHIAGATEIQLGSVSEGLDVLRRGCVERTTKSTKMNSQSSRSHAIFTLFLRKEVEGNFVSSKFSFVDLAGSERLKRTLCIGERARESISINSGLLALGNVISALYKKARHVPFRDSKLTRILHSCLNGHVLMIACISSCQSDMSETHNTLKYANRAASIQTTTRLNIEVDNSKMTTLLLKKEISKLRNENQILRERIRKVEHANVEELMRENRHLKSQVDNFKYEANEKNEDLAQEILKHPFVQNLINDNQKLSEENEELRRRRKNPNEEERENEVNQNQEKSRKEPKEVPLSPVYPLTSISPLSPVSPSLSTSESNPSPNQERTVLNGLNSLDILSQNGTLKKSKSPPSPPPPPSISLPPYKKVKDSEDLKISWNDFKQPKKVTFKIEESHSNKRMLFTPRKDKVRINTDIVRFLEGYTPQSMTILNGSLVFSSLDNKVRVWKDRVEDLFSDSGIKHLESSDIIYYTTRTILKQFDHRSVCMPIHAYLGEISCIKKIGHKIYTGHDDGSLNILDLRNMQLETIKLHNGSIFCIENVNGSVFTGSRDHSVKAITPGKSIEALSPPHCDSVMSLLSYKGDLVSLGRDSSIRRWSGNRLVRTISNSHCSSLKTGLSLSHVFVTGDKSGLLKFWDFHKSNLFTVGELNLNNSINCLCKADDGGFYAGTSRKNISYVVSNFIV